MIYYIEFIFVITYKMTIMKHKNIGKYFFLFLLIIHTIAVPMNKIKGTHYKQKSSIKTYNNQQIVLNNKENSIIYADINEFKSKKTLIKQAISTQNQGPASKGKGHYMGKTIRNTILQYIPQAHYSEIKTTYVRPIPSFYTQGTHNVVTSSEDFPLILYNSTFSMVVVTSVVTPPKNSVTNTIYVAEDI